MKDQKSESAYPFSKRAAAWSTYPSAESWFSEKSFVKRFNCLNFLGPSEAFISSTVALALDDDATEVEACKIFAVAASAGAFWF